MFDEAKRLAPYCQSLCEQRRSYGHLTHRLGEVQVHTPQKFDRPSTAYTPPHFPIREPSPWNRRPGYRPPARDRAPRGRDKETMVLNGAPEVAEIPTVVASPRNLRGEIATRCTHRLTTNPDVYTGGRAIAQAVVMAALALKPDLHQNQVRALRSVSSGGWRDASLAAIVSSVGAIIKISENHKAMKTLATGTVRTLRRLQPQVTTWVTTTPSSLLVA